MGVFPSIAEITEVKTSGLYQYGAHASSQAGITIPAGWLGDMLRIQIDYILELWDKGVLVTAVSLPQVPTSVKVKKPFARSLIYTFGAEPIRNHAINRKLDIEFLGKTGVKDRQGYSRQGKLITENGLIIMLEFDAFLDRYQQIATDSGAHKYIFPEALSSQYDDDTFGGHGTFLVLRCLEERLHVKVEPLSFEYTRDADQTRKGASWSFNVTAYAPALPKKPGGMLGKLQGAIDAATAYVGAVNNLIAAGNTIMDNINTGLDGLRAPFQAIVKTGVALRGIVATGGQIANFPRALIADALMASEQFAAAYSDAKAIAQAIDASWTDLFAVSSNTDELRPLGAAAEKTLIYAKQMHGAAGLGPDAAETAANAVLPEAGSSYEDTKSYIPESDVPLEFGDAGDIVAYVVDAGTSLPDIVKKLYNTPGSLSAIMQYNNLQDPFTWASGAPLVPGDVLLLPDTGLSSGGMFLDKNNDIENMFGTDLLLDPKTGDLVVNDGQTDLKIIRGPTNLEQALRHRCSTPVGTSRCFPRYGLPFSPGETIPKRRWGYLGAHIHEQVKRDRRVASLENLVILDGGDTVGLSFEVVAEIGTNVGVLAALG